MCFTCAGILKPNPRYGSILKNFGIFSCALLMIVLVLLLIIVIVAGFRHPDNTQKTRRVFWVKPAENLAKQLRQT